MPNKLIALLVLLTLRAQAADIYNSYLWNRANAIAQNGRVDRGDWFEWWYFKVVDPATDNAFLFTYGVVNPWDKSRERAASKAFLQFGEFDSRLFVEKNYSLAEFQASYDATDVRIAGNRATDRSLAGEITDERGRRIRWDLRLKRDWRFDAMGWTMSTQASGIYWYPAQASASMTGTITIGDRTILLENAPAYQDRNWGRSFPKWWTWITSNDFENSPGTALAVGGGEPKLFDSAYLLQGLCIGLKHEGREYVFRTTDPLNRVDFEIHWGRWRIVAENGKGERIEIDAYAPPEKFMDLPFQTPSGPLFHDYEALQGDLSARLYRWSATGGWQPIAQLHSRHAGIEWGSPDQVESVPSHFHFQSGF